MSLRKLVFAAAVALTAACGSVAPQRDVTCGAQPVSVLPNGSFEDATPAWVQNAPTPSLLCGTDITAADGVRAACMGGMDGKVQTLSQGVPLPAGAKKATLSGQICITTQETAAVDNDVLQFQLLDGDTVLTTLGQFSNQQGVKENCMFMAFTPLVGVLASDPPTATLQLKTMLNTQNTTSFFIDALTLDVSCTQ